MPRRLLAVVLAAQSAGCSLTLMDRASRTDPGVRPVACDDDMTYPAIDGAITAASIGALVWLFSREPPEEGTGLVDPRLLVVGLTAATAPLVYIPSGLVGYFAAKRCRRYNATPPPQPVRPEPPKPWVDPLAPA